MSHDEQTYLTPDELSKRYRGRVAVRTLANWRCLGVGPRFSKIGGRILYALTDIQDWESRCTAESTAGYVRL